MLHYRAAAFAERLMAAHAASSANLVNLLAHSRKDLTGLPNLAKRFVAHITRVELGATQMRARIDVAVPFDCGEPLTHRASRHSSRPQFLSGPAVEKKRKSAIHRQIRFR